MVLIKENKERAFQELFNRFWEKLYVSALKTLRNEDTSKDVVQDVFVELWDKRMFLEIRKVESYLYQAVRFKALMQLRKQKLTEIHHQILNNIPYANTTTDIIDFHETRNILTRGMTNLPSKCKEIFYLSRVQQLTNKQIADKLNLSVRTVETHISNALKKLRLMVEEATLIIITLLINFF